MNTTSTSTTSSSSSSSSSRRVITYAGRAEYGRPPKVFREGGDGGAARIERMEFVIYDFPTVAQHTRRGEYILTGILTAQGHQWRLLIYPRGGVVGATEDPPRPPHDRYAPAATARTTPPIHEAEYVSFYLCCVDEEEEEEDHNNNARSTSNSSRIEVEPARYNPSSTNHNNPTGTTPTVLAKALFRTTTIIGEFPKYEYNRHNTTRHTSSTMTMDRGLGISLPKEYILQHDCNAVGTLKVIIELQVAVALQPPPVWIPPRAASVVAVASSFSNPTHSSYSHSSSSSSSVSVSSTDSADSNQGNGNGSLECYSSIANFGSHLYGNDETSDVTFIVGRKKTTFVAHKCILALRARELYELVLIEESSSSSASSSDDDNNNDDDEEEESVSNSSRRSNSTIFLSDVDEQAFEVLLKFIYTDAVPDLEKDHPTCYDTNNSTNNRNTISNKNSKHDTQVAAAAVAAETETSTNRGKAEDMAKVILMVATKFGVTTLKLYMESYLVEKVAVIPAKIAGLLLFADSYLCGLLKEACMNVFVKHSKEIITMVRSGETPTTTTTNTTPNNTKNTDWFQLQQSNELLTELLLYTTTGRKHYSSVVEDGIGTLQDAEDYDVTSLRERLQKFQLDVDGSREILVQRWKTYFLQQRPQQDERRRHPQRP